MQWSALWAAVTGISLCAASQAAHRPKVLIIYDMEGVSGAVHPDYVRSSKKLYPEGRRILTEDVNAAIRGLSAGGAAAIWVQDGHASGNSQEPDILLDRMDPRARFDFRKYPFSAYTTGLDASIDAIVCIGMHARAGAGGFIAHTFNLETAYRVNDVDFTETHIVAMSAARWGIPVIMVSGDNILGEQLKPDFPDLEYATVKTAKSRAEAVALPAGEAYRRIEQSARKGIEKFLQGQYRAYFLPPPYRFEVSYRNAEQLAAALRHPAVERASDRSVRFTTPVYMDGYLIAASLFSAGNDRYETLLRLLESDPAGRRLLEQFQDAFWQRFVDPDAAPSWTKSREGQPAVRSTFWGAQ